MLTPHKVFGSSRMGSTVGNTTHRVVEMPDGNVKMGKPPGGGWNCRA